MTSRLSRRDAIKALAAAGAVIAAAPYMATASGAIQPVVADSKRTTSHVNSTEPLVIVVTQKTMMGFRGDEEFSVEDADLASQLNMAFARRGAE